MCLNDPARRLHQVVRCARVKLVPIFDPMDYKLLAHTVSISLVTVG